MNIVAGFMQPSAGVVTLDGKPISGPGPDRGVIFQEYGVFPWLSVRDNIAFGLNLRANRTPSAARDTPRIASSRWASASRTRASIASEWMRKPGSLK